MFICSSIPTSKNKVYRFGKTSTDLAGIIQSSLEFDVRKYHKDSNLFVCRQCFQQLTTYERAAKKPQEIKQELLTALRNREQLREKRLARDKKRRSEIAINNEDVQVSAAKSLQFLYGNFTCLSGHSIFYPHTRYERYNSDWPLSPNSDSNTSVLIQK